jgi:hypothetical protein
MKHVCGGIGEGVGCTRAKREKKSEKIERKTNICRDASGRKPLLIEVALPDCRSCECERRIPVEARGE